MKRGLFSLFLCIGCTSLPHDSPKQIQSYDEIDTTQGELLDGKVVRVEGKYGYAKRGPFLETPRGRMVYIDKVDSWPKHSEQIALLGRLRFHPEQTEPENGAAYIKGPYFSADFIEFVKPTR